MRVGVFLILLLIMPSVTAYYADVELDVQRDGSVLIRGVSNHPLLQESVTSNLTSKNGERWVFNLTLAEQFDDFVITVLLPEGSELNYVSSRSAVAIGSQDNRVTLKRVGSKDSLALIAQYRNVPEENNVQLLLILGSFVLLLGFGVSYTRAIVRKPRKHVDRSEKQEVFIRESTIGDLPIRQQDIIKLLERAERPLTQKQVQEALGIPKASASRNISSLFRRGLIQKEQSGMTNTIWLTKK